MPTTGWFDNPACKYVSSGTPDSRAAIGELTLRVEFRIPRWKRAVLDVLIWALNRVIGSLRNNVEVA